PDGMQRGLTAQHPDLAQTLASQAARLPAPSSGDLARPTPPKFPDWLYQLVTMPLPQVSNAFDPQTGRRVVPYDPLINLVGHYPIPAPNAPPTGGARIDIPSISPLPRLNSAEVPGTAASQGANPRPATEKAMWSTWPQPLKDGSPYPPVAGPQIQ